MIEDIFIKICIVVLILCALFEVGILAYAYFNADEVNCNFLWCEFKTEAFKIWKDTERCYYNNELVNCSNDFEKNFIDAQNRFSNG